MVGRVLLLSSTIASLLVLNWIFVRWAAPANCINSTFVDKIDMVDEGRPTTIENCTLYVRMFGPLVDEGSGADKIIRRVTAFEKAALVWQRPETAVHVRITLGDDLSFKENVLAMGRRYLDSEDFEISLLTIASPHQDPVTRESVARLFWHLFNPGKVNLNTWPSYLQTLVGYCAGDHLLVHREFCQLQAELGEGLISDGQDDGAIVWSLLPLLSDTLQYAFKQIKPEDRRIFLERTFLLGAFDDESLFGTNLKGIRDLERQYFTLMRLWLMPLVPDDAVLDALEERASVVKARYVYVVNDTGRPFSLPRGQSRQAIVESGAKKRFSPSDVGLRLSRSDLFSNLNIDEVIFVGCKMPTPKKLLGFSSWMKTVYFIQKCKDQKLNWAGLTDLGTLRFAVERKKAKVFEFNLRSLRVAERWKGPLKGSSLNDWQRWLDWKGVTLDAQKDFLRPLSVIDAITRFRNP